MPAETALTVSPELWDRARAILKALKDKGLSIVTAESCTAGMIVAVLSRGRRRRNSAWRLRHLHEGAQANRVGRIASTAARPRRSERGSREAACNQRLAALSGIAQPCRQRRARPRGGRGRQPGRAGLFLLHEIGSGARRRERGIREGEARTAFTSHDRPRVRSDRILYYSPRPMPDDLSHHVGIVSTR